MRRLRFRFRVPKTHGAIYDPQTKRSYFFTINVSENEIEMFIREMEQYLTHETLHYVIHKLMGKRVQDKFDIITKKVNEWDKEVYAMLF